MNKSLNHAAEILVSSMEELSARDSRSKSAAEYDALANMARALISLCSRLPQMLPDYNKTARLADGRGSQQDSAQKNPSSEGRGSKRE